MTATILPAHTSNSTSNISTMMSDTINAGAICTTITSIIATNAKAFSYITLPCGPRTALNYLQSFGVTSESVNNGADDRFVTSYSGNISYTANPIMTIPYFTAHNRVRVIDGARSADGLDWTVFNFGVENGSTNAFFGGDNTADAGKGDAAITTGHIWGYDMSNGWTLLYQMSIPGTGICSHSAGNWFISGGTVTTGNGKRAEFDSTQITLLGFSVA